MTGFFCSGKSDAEFLRFLKKAEFIEENDRFVMISDDKSAAVHISHIDRLYFFVNIKDGTDEDNSKTAVQCEEFCRTMGIDNMFIFSRFGKVRQNGELYKYVFLERLSGGNPILRNELTRMIKEYKLTELALSGARDNAESYIKENPYEARNEGFVPSTELEYSIRSYYYSVSGSCEEHIAVEVEMRNHDGVIGYYTILFDSGNGVIFDDIFYEPF